MHVILTGSCNETATVAILAPSSEVGPEMAADKTAKPFGLAVLDILERSLRPSNGRNIFSTLTQLDLTGTMHSGIDDYGAIRSLFSSSIPSSARTMWKGGYMMKGKC